MVKGDADMLGRSLESGAMPFYIGNDGKEAIYIFGSEFFIISNGSMDRIGWSKEETIEKLKKLGKNQNFPFF
jgi:hypothetical protein